MSLGALPYRRIIAADFEFEFGGRDGNRSRPVCMVAKDLRSGQCWRTWRGEFGTSPPFPVDEETLFVAYYASAELGCFKALGWKMPARILDLSAEFRRHVNNGTKPLLGYKLIGALGYFGLDTISAQEKREMIDLVLTGGPWSMEQREAILNYCESDVTSLERLLPAMLLHIDLPRALLRGRYMAAAAAIEFTGIPIDVEILGRLRQHWTAIKDQLISAIDVEYGVFEGQTFKTDRFEAFLVRHQIPWERLQSGRLNLEDKTFRNMAKIYPILSPLHELRYALSKLKLNDLCVGQDGRNRALLSAFASKTGRNQPSNSKFIFGPSVWLRGLIKPEPGHGLAYIDWSSQEFGIAAKLSGDQNMMDAYTSGDPYLTFGKQCGRLPPDATKQSHGDERERLKQCVLGTQYGMGAATLAFRMSQCELVARNLLRAHRNTFRKFWAFAQGAIDTVQLGNPLSTVFGWTLWPGPAHKPQSLQNFPMQANGAEMLRIACCLATERGIPIVAPVHDAVMIYSPLDRLEQDVADMRAAMAEASRAVLDGFEIRTDVHVVKYPDRYEDGRGRVMWQRVMELLDRCERSEIAEIA